MLELRARLQFPVLALCLALLTGCPGLIPELRVSREAISFGETNVSASFTIQNAGAGTLSWSVEPVERADADAPWTSATLPWLSIDPAAGSTTTGMDRVTLSITRQDLPFGTLQNVGVRVLSNGGDRVVPIAVVVVSTLQVSPSAVSLPPDATSAEFSIVNTGQENVDWEIFSIPTPGATDNPGPVPSDIQLSQNPGSTAAGTTTRVTLSFPADRGDFHLFVRSDSGSGVVSFLFGAALQDLEVSPRPLTLFISDPEAAQQPPSLLRIRNVGNVTRNWTVEVASLRNPEESVGISLNPAAGNTAPGATSEVAVRVTNTQTVIEGAGNYEVIVRSGNAFLAVPVVVEFMSLPEIGLSSPVRDIAGRPEISLINTLDFGREQVQMQFYVANLGPRDSRLQFRIRYEGQEEPNSLIASVTPLQGNTNGPGEEFIWPPGSNELINAQAITVVVDRGQLRETVEERQITVEAYDADLQNRLEIVESATLRVRVERPPLKVEGALNRSRPPFVSRFVFLLRDDLGRAVPTQTAQDRDRIRFHIFESGMPLDLNETNRFIGGPEDLKVNLVLMLDFTGSMLHAGTASGDTPLAPGEALQQVREATEHFLDDLPPGYQVALMYYHDRQQHDYLIAPFSTDREALKTALRQFHLPPAHHGVSAIFDALVEGIEYMASEDPEETLPFDDADIRALIFISDGQDNASEADLGEVTDLARDNRVQLYPLGYSPGVHANTGDMVLLAEESNGHFYGAGDVRNLQNLLASERPLVLESASETAANAVHFRIGNLGQASVAWSTQIEPGANWISSVSPGSGSTAPGGSTLVRVNLNPQLAPANRTVEGNVYVQSAGGNAEVTIRMTVDAANTITDLEVGLRDEPGAIWKDLRNQIVLSYVVPAQSETNYAIDVDYTKPDGQVLRGHFEEDGIFYPGNIRAGQLSMRTSGIAANPRAAADEEVLQARVFVRAEYVPRGVNRFRLRFFPLLAPDAPAGAATALANVQMNVTLARDGLLLPEDAFTPTWRLVPEGDGIYTMLTDEANPLPYGAFGNLLEITFTGLDEFGAVFAAAGRAPEFLLAMRADNAVYYAPATPGTPSLTNFFLYPGGFTYPDRVLLVGPESDLAPPARTIADLQDPGIDPEAPGAWDRDGDGVPDFQDPAPDMPQVPGPLAVPAQVAFPLGQTQAVLVVRNNRLDTFSWALDETSVPAWLEVSTVSAEPSFTLAPGESEVLELTVDRTGLPGGTTSGGIVLDLGIFGEQFVPVTVSAGQ